MVAVVEGASVVAIEVVAVVSNVDKSSSSTGGVDTGDLECLRPSEMSRGWCSAEGLGQACARS